MTEVQSKRKIIADLKKENEELKKELEAAKSFFADLAIIKLPLLMKGKPGILLECMIGKETADKIKEMIDTEQPETEQYDVKHPEPEQLNAVTTI